MKKNEESITMTRDELKKYVKKIIEEEIYEAGYMIVRRPEMLNQDLFNDLIGGPEGYEAWKKREEEQREYFRTQDALNKLKKTINEKQNRRPKKPPLSDH